MAGVTWTKMRSMGKTKEFRNKALGAGVVAIAAEPQKQVEGLWFGEEGPAFVLLLTTQCWALCDRVLPCCLNVKPWSSVLKANY